MPRHLFRPMTVRISSGIEGGKSPINGKCRFRPPSGLCGLMTTSSPAISTECSCSQEAFVPARLFMSAVKPNVKYWRSSVRSAISTRPQHPMSKIFYVTISICTKTRSIDCINSETRKTCFKTKH